MSSYEDSFPGGLKLCCHSLYFREISKDKDKCDGGEDEEGKEHNTPRGRKTANSQGRRKGRITTRSMAIEAASVAADEAPPTATDPSLSDPPQLSRSDSAQRAIKEPVKPQIPIASLDTNKGTGIFLPKQDSIPFTPYTMWIHDVAHFLFRSCFAPCCESFFQHIHKYCQDCHILGYIFTSGFLYIDTNNILKWSSATLAFSPSVEDTLLFVHIAPLVIGY